MTDVIQIGNKSTYIDATLRANLDDMKAEIRKDNDVVIVVDGRERIGKSVFAMGVGWYLSDGKLTLNNICLTPEAIRERIRNSEKYEVIIFDECYLGLASEDVMSKYNRLLKKMLVTCGQKNLILILVLPSVFDISKYVALHRADCLLHAFKHKGQRGHFAFYNNRNLQKLYVFGKKIYSYYKPKPNFNGRFTNFYAVDEKAYRKKKADSLNTFLKSSEEETLGKKSQIIYNLINYIHTIEPKKTNKSLAEAIGCSERTIYRAIKRGVVL